MVIFLLVMFVVINEITPEKKLSVVNGCMIPGQLRINKLHFIVKKRVFCSISFSVRLWQQMNIIFVHDLKLKQQDASPEQITVFCSLLLQYSIILRTEAGMCSRKKKPNFYYLYYYYHYYFYAGKKPEG